MPLLRMYYISKTSKYTPKERLIKQKELTNKNTNGDSNKPFSQRETCISAQIKNHLDRFLGYEYKLDFRDDL
jgi:hypothetical protein